VPVIVPATRHIRLLPHVIPRRLQRHHRANRVVRPRFAKSEDGSPQEFVKPLFSLSFRDWAVWCPDSARRPRK
jgi:hypothetical protein